MKKIVSILTLSLFCGMMFAQSYNLIPRPVEVTPAKGSFSLTSAAAIVAGKGSKQVALYLQQKLNRSTGMPFKLATTSAVGSIELIVNSALDIPAEGYLLSATDKGVKIEGKDADGLFYGVQTLLQLLPPQVYSAQLQGGIQWTIPAVSVKDYPRFHYRGMMLDVVRQFFDEQTVKNYIDWLAIHKINKFHWHLTDDQGWRIEIKKYPKLTSVAAWRGPNEAIAPTLGSGDKRYGGFYTQKQIKEIVRYAAEQHIEVIPEIDLPGHSHAAASAYPEILCPTSRDEAKRAADDMADAWCVGNETNFTMLANILKEVAALFPSKIIHIGGDEVNMAIWPRCPICSAFMKKENMQKPEELQNYFVHRLNKIIDGLGKRMAGWDEILDGGDLEGSTQVYAWRSLKRAEVATEKGVPTVVMVGQNYYFDMAQSKYERGHNWAGLVPLDKVYALDPADNTVFTAEQAKKVMGVQAAIWSELFNEPARFLDYQSYPRICAMAEAGWTQQSLRNWNDFYQRLTSSHFERMYNMGIAFRVPFPVVTYKNELVTAVAPYPGAEVRYTVDGSEPNASSVRYSGPVKEFNYEKLKFKTIYKDLSSVAVSPECENVGGWVSDSAAKPKPQVWDLSGIVDRPGIWYATFVPDQPTKGSASVSQVRVYENGIAVASDDKATATERTQRYRLPLFAFDKTKKYSLKAIVQGKENVSGVVKIERSRCMEPAVGVSVNANLNPEYARYLTDYDFETVARTIDRGVAGQSVTYVFAQPLTCSKITFNTGTLTAFYLLKNGHVEYSVDGENWIRGDKFEKGIAVLRPSQPLKAVKIVIDGPNDEAIIAFQDLKIE
ncbi:beta-N-acetylhexosaminidase [Paludibacter jiangxiensis]|uniref:beta-N-acetylhexosaminidase n=1 Tax=Paludibacter jiangxiensis TaxID=681398 RepID=A0A170YGX5_9BACT|nr:family 20 glycosylhydrolase [Paludibacter jiangxiensis]GAT61799.1 hexosaminidase [Paludibacter jiangxiensis]